MTNAFASQIVRLSKTQVTFRNKRTVTIPAGSPYADDLVFAKRARRPVLVRITPDHVITFAGPAWISGVNRTRPTKNGLLVYLRGRSSALFLQSSLASFTQFAAFFANAPNTKRVFAVAYTPGEETITDAIPSRSEALSGERIVSLRRPPRARLKRTTEAALRGALATLAAAECRPTKLGGVADRSECVPFNYPKNGCNGRAAYMCRLFTQRRIASAKVWCFAPSDEQISVASLNSPCGRAFWGFHVAALVLLNGTELVIDPALSNAPMTIPAWRGLMSGGDRARVVITSANVFGLDEPIGRVTWSVHYDTRGARAAAELADARETLSRSAKLNGPPPYPVPLIPC